MALADSTPAPQASVGYAGTASDGLTQLDTAHALTPYTSAPDGHIVATQELSPGPGRARSTLALGFGRTQAGAVSTAQGSLSGPFAVKELKYLAGWVGVRREPEPAAGALPGRAGQRDGAAGPALLPVRERAQGERGQDVPRRDRGVAGQPVGPGGASRDRLRWRACLLRLLPRGVLPRPVRGLHRPAHGRRPGHGAGRGPVPVRPPAAGRRGHAAQLAAQRQGRPGHRRAPAGRGRLPDPDGLPGGPERGRHAVGRPRPAGGRLPGRPRALGRQRAVGGADRLLTLDHRGRDRRADRGVRHRRRPRRPGAGPALPGDGRLLPAQHQVLGRDHDRAGRAALLHQAVQDRRPERGDHLQPRQRRPDRGPAQRHRRRVPGAGPARGAARQRPGRAGLAGRAGQADIGQHAQRNRLLPVRHVGRRRQRGRLRRLLPAEPDLVHDHGRAVAAHRHRDRSSVARAVRRAGRERHRRRAELRGRQPAERDAQFLLRCRPGARAGLGGPGPAGVAVRQRPGDRVHRVHRRQGRRIGLAADLGPGPGTAADHGARNRPHRRDAGGHDGALPHPRGAGCADGHPHRPRLRRDARVRDHDGRPGPRRPAPRWTSARRIPRRAPPRP